MFNLDKQKTNASLQAVMCKPNQRPCDYEPTEKTPTAHLAHLVLPNTQGDLSQNQKS
jgi:hypothetical protein